MTNRYRLLGVSCAVGLGSVCLLFGLLAATPPKPAEGKGEAASKPADPTTSAAPVIAPQRSRFYQSQAEAENKSSGCISCHGRTEASSMHPTGTVHLGCAD